MSQAALQAQSRAISSISLIFLNGGLDLSLPRQTPSPSIFLYLFGDVYVPFVAQTNAALGLIPAPVSIPAGTLNGVVVVTVVVVARVVVVGTTVGMGPTVGR